MLYWVQPKTWNVSYKIGNFGWGFFFSHALIGTGDYMDNPFFGWLFVCFLFINISRYYAHLMSPGLLVVLPTFCLLFITFVHFLQSLEFAIFHSCLSLLNVKTFVWPSRLELWWALPKLQVASVLQRKSEHGLLLFLLHVAPIYCVACCCSLSQVTTFKRWLIKTKLVLTGFWAWTDSL